jgi:hypothetical protein
LRIRREVLALPNRITSKISAPLFGARARLTLLPWVAAMEFPVALLAILCLFAGIRCGGNASVSVSDVSLKYLIQVDQQSIEYNKLTITGL